MTEAAVQPPSEFVQFWNEILVPKFIKYKHVLVGGLTKHSDAIFPKLEVNDGERVMDAGAGFGDTAIMLAKRVGPNGCLPRLRPQRRRRRGHRQYRLR